MKKIDIPNYDNYELHYSDSEQLIYSKKRKKYLKNNITNNGYYHVVLCNSEGIKGWYLHRIVYACFNGEIPENLEVNHINENKLDNRISNLNLMTRKENINYGNRNQKVAEKLSMPIVGVNKKTLDVTEFPSLIEAERINKKFDKGHISTCCQHKRQSDGSKKLTVNGYYWFYKDEFNQLLDEYKGNIQSIIKYKISRY